MIDLAAEYQLHQPLLGKEIITVLEKVTELEFSFLPDKKTEDSKDEYDAVIVLAK